MTEMMDATRSADESRLDRAWTRTWARVGETVVALARAVREGREATAHERSLDVQATALLLCSLPARHEFDILWKRSAEDVVARVEATSPSCALQMADVAVWGDCQALGLEPDDWREHFAVH